VAPAFTIVAVFLFESARSLRSFVPLPPGWTRPLRLLRLLAAIPW